MIDTTKDEARRFLRYVIPGLSFVVQTILLLCGLIPDGTLEMVAEQRTDKGICIVIAELFGWGGLGFVFGTGHHAILWHGQQRWITCPVFSSLKGNNHVLRRSLRSPH